MDNKTTCILYNDAEVFNSAGNENSDSKDNDSKYELDCGPEEPQLKEYRHEPEFARIIRLFHKRGGC